MRKRKKFQQEDGKFAMAEALDGLNEQLDAE